VGSGLGVSELEGSGSSYGFGDFLFTGVKDSMFAQAVEQHWLGGKKNDVIVITGLDGGRPIWAYVMAWTDNELFKIKLRDDILTLTDVEVQRDQFFNFVRANVEQYYVRKPMKDFAYLAASITPSWIELTIAMVVGMVASPQSWAAGKGPLPFPLGNSHSFGRDSRQ
jgi:hypothetical protein